MTRYICIVVLLLGSALHAGVTESEPETIQAACGSKCLYEACNVQGVAADMTSIVKTCQRTIRSQSSFADLKRGADGLGLCAETYEVSLDNIQRLGNLFILKVRDQEHFVLIRKRGNEFVLFDPDDGFWRRVTVNELSPRWGNYAMTLTRGATSGGSLTLDEYMADLGAMRRGEAREYSIQLHNRGDRALAVKDVRANCTCSVPVLDKKQLAPSESTTLRFRFTAPSTAGGAEGACFILTDDAREPVTKLAIRAVVEATYVAYPNVLNFGNVRIGSPAEKTFEIVRESAELPVPEVLRIQYDSEILRVTPDSSSSGSVERPRIRVKVIGTQSGHILRVPIRVHIRQGDVSTVVMIPVLGYVTPKYACTPSGFIWTQSDSAPRKVTIDCSSGGVPDVKALTYNEKVLKVQASCSENTLVLEATVVAGAVAPYTSVVSVGLISGEIVNVPVTMWDRKALTAR